MWGGLWIENSTLKLIETTVDPMHETLYNSKYGNCNSKEEWCNEDYEVQQ